MTKIQEKDLFDEWALYGPQEQRKMIDEYLSVNAENCSRDRFLNFIKEKFESREYCKMVVLA